MSKERREPEQDENPSAAPGDLELVRSFVNTLDVEAGTDRLGTLREARAWLAAHGHGMPRSAGEGGLRRLVEFREAVRDAISDRGTSNGAAAMKILDRLASAHPVTVRLGAPFPFAQREAGIDGFVERVLGILAAARITGTWERLKACPNDGCRWLFYDHSRNGSRTWCSMSVCGARSKMRTYRASRRSASGVSGPRS